MSFRVNLLFPVYVVIARLDFAATRAYDPPGTPTSGLNDILRAPVVINQGGVRTVARVEMAEVKVPCQREDKTLDQLSMAFTGNDPVTTIAFVLHRKDLDRLGLLDSDGNCVLKARDRIARVEDKRGNTVETWPKPLFIYEIRGGSHGMGPTGRDLQIVYTTYQSADSRLAR